MDEPKTEEELREEIATKYELSEDDEREKKLIDGFLEEKKNRYTATKQKQEKDKMLQAVIKGKEYYKGLAKKADQVKQTKSEGEKPTEELNKQPLIPESEVSIMFGKGELKNRRELTELKKVMQITGKSHNKALQDSTFTTWRDNNDKLITSQGSQLNASRGGANHGEETDDANFTKKAKEAFKPKK